MRTFAVLIIILSNLVHAFEGMTVAIPEPNGIAQEQILQIDTDLSCGKSADFPGIHGIIRTPSRTVRVDLFQRQTQAFIERSSAMRLELLPNSGCELSRVEFTYHDLDNDLGGQVLRHAPFLVARGNQYANPETDVPMLLSYSLWTNLNNAGQRISISIRYTVYFSDEDSMTSTNHELAQMARYGRAADIEWIYEVELDYRTYEPLKRFYQSDIAYGIGHRRVQFAGEFVTGTQHPVLYNITNHNVFRDRPYFQSQRREKVGYVLVPQFNVIQPLAREAALFENSWTFRVTENELRRERKPIPTIENFLFVRIRGSLQSGSFRGILNFDGENTTYTSGGGNGNIDRLGEDLWERESYTAIPIGASGVQYFSGNRHGRFTLASTSWRTSSLIITELELFRLSARDGRLEFRPLENVSCVPSGLRSACGF